MEFVVFIGGKVVEEVKFFRELVRSLLACPKPFLLVLEELVLDNVLP